MGFQLNGYETVLAASPSTAGPHCENCCNSGRSEHFTTANGDLWVVNQDGVIAVLPFGDDEFQVKYRAKNYIPWRPYEPNYRESCIGRPKDSFLKPFWKDYTRLFAPAGSGYCTGIIRR